MSPASIDFGTVKNQGAEGGATAPQPLNYNVAMDELARSPSISITGGSGSIFFKTASPFCEPPLPGPPNAGSCTYLITASWNVNANGPASGTAVIDADGQAFTTGDRLSVPLAINVQRGAPGGKKKKCKKKGKKGAAAAKKKGCKKKK